MLDAYNIILRDEKQSYFLHEAKPDTALYPMLYIDCIRGIDQDIYWQTEFFEKVGHCHRSFSLLVETVLICRGLYDIVLLRSEAMAVRSGSYM